MEPSWFFRLFFQWQSIAYFIAVSNANGDLAAYKGVYSRDLSPAATHVTIPKKVSPEGAHLSHHVTHFHDAHPVHFNITLPNHLHDFQLAVAPATHFLGPGLVLERRKRDVHTRTRPPHKSRNCHFNGVVRGQPNSRVAISACNGLAGMIHMEEGKYFIEPEHIKGGEIAPGHPHLIYKRSAVSKKRKKRKRRKDCGTKEPKKLTELWQKELGRLRVQERRQQHHHHQRIDIPSLNHADMKKHKYRARRSISKPQYVETLLVADATMVEFHEDGNIETYLLTIMNMVSSLYLDPSIGNLINVVVVKIILIDDAAAEPELDVEINADATLRNFCKWQRNLNPANDSHPYHHDVAILITRKDICSKNNVPCHTVGVAHVSGMCKTSRSCSVNEDNGITVANTIAHEMGHNFGMYHDTEKVGCKGREGNTSHVMTPSFQSDTVGISWSRCSRRDITNFLDKGLGECLQDEPINVEEYEYPELPPGAMYNANLQCRFQFGVDATVCSPLTDLCGNLWCNVNDSCISRLHPAAPGTNCGKHKWCQEQKCVPMMEPAAAMDGGWGDWGEWSACSRSCGAGVSMTQRECDHPTPTAGGRFCTGERRRYKMCNTDACPPEAPTFRALQCALHDAEPHEGRLYAWRPYFDQAEPCQLYCSDANETVIVPWGEAADDGTPCNVGERDICIAGICRRVGCDWAVDSLAHEDDCGICQGDGTKCDKVQGTYRKQSHGAGYREIVVIPSGARNVRIEENGQSENYISIGSALSRKFYLNGKRHITLPGEYTVAGAQALYERDVHQERVRIPGPIRKPIVVYVIFRGKTHNPGISYRYSILKREATLEVKYTWLMGQWSQCSATCGGGVQEKKPLCQESTVGALMGLPMDGIPTIVDEMMCDTSAQPEQIVRVCNEDPCPSLWWVGPWQSCPVSCARKDERAPMKRRSVMCVDGAEMALPDRFCDKNVKPVEFELCRTLPQCAA